LKDASATAIYGSRGANGVVIVTTKSGKAGKGKITFDTYAGLQNVTKKVDVLSTDEFVAYHIESRNNGWLQSAGNPATPNASRGTYAVAPVYFDPGKWSYTDWQDEIFRTGNIQNFNLAFTGGNENTKYAISASHFINNGIIIETYLKRYSAKINVDTRLNNRVNVGVRLTPSYSVNNEANTDGHFSGAIVGLAQRLPGVIGPYLPDGSYTNPLSLRNPQGLGSIGAVDNPVAKAKEDQYDLSHARFLGNIFLEYAITQDLKFKSSLGIDANFNRTHRFLSSKTGRAGTAPPNVPSGIATSAQELEWLNENLLTYNKRFGTSVLTGIAGFSVQKNDYQFIQVNGTNYPNDNVQYVSAAGIVNAGTKTEVNGRWCLILAG
jgi:TonB-dependent SusC/RagA subfamily outer membrane receptor